MDENKGGTPSGRDTREELRSQLQATGKAAGELLEQLVRIPQILAQIPLQMMPEDASSHAQNAAREGFEAVRKLLDSMAKGIEQVMGPMNPPTGGSGSSGSAPSAGSEGKSSNGNGNGNGATRRMDGEGGDEPGGHPTQRLD